MICNVAVLTTSIAELFDKMQKFKTISDKANVKKNNIVKTDKKIYIVKPIIKSSRYTRIY